MSITSRRQPVRAHHVVTAHPVAVSMDWWLADATLFIDVVGELCAWSSPIWSRSIDVLVATQGTRTVVVSMQGVTFFDAAGVSALLRLRRRLRGRGIDLTVGATSPAVTRVLELARLERIAPRRILTSVE